MCKPEWQSKLKKIGLSKAEDWTALTGNHAVSRSYSTRISRLRVDNHTAIYFKCYAYEKPKLKHWFQPTKAAVEAAGLHELRKLGIPTVNIIAYGERRRFGFTRATFIVTEAIPGQLAMDRYLTQIRFQLPYRRKRDVFDKLQPIIIGQLQKIHRAGFFHWDLKLRNLLITIPVSDRPSITWIDCPRFRRSSPDRFFGVVKDLADMARVGARVLTTGQQFRFLLDYCNGDKTQARKLYLAIANRLKKNPPKSYRQLLAKMNLNTSKCKRERLD